MEIIGIAGASKETAEALESSLDRYRDQLFPGRDAYSKKDAWEEEAKRMIAQEAQRVYVVRSGGQSSESLKVAAQSGNPEVKKWAQHEMHKQAQAQMRLKKRLTRGKKPTR